MPLPEQIFVTGTDTGIGKTVVSAILTMGLDATYWKPVQSGLEEETDREAVRRLTGLPDSRFPDERYRLTEPLSPHAAADIDGKKIALSDFRLPERDTRHLVVEGAGGLLVPLNGREMIIDLIARLELPVLLVARSGLGTLNHTFLSLEALRRRKIPVVGAVLNGPRNRSNREAIERIGGVPVLLELEPMPQVTRDRLTSAFGTLRAAASDVNPN